VSPCLDSLHAACYPLRVLRRIEQWTVVLLLAVLIGGHWIVLQSVAWAGMLVSYSHTSSVTEAWTKTFDGKHPCKLCKMVREGKKSESKQEMLKVEVKLEFSFVCGTAWLFPPRPCSQFVVADSSALARIEAPLTPPPRSA
jgi:hypothetical protein